MNTLINYDTSFILDEISIKIITWKQVSMQLHFIKKIIVFYYHSDLLILLIL